jgi:hypothetical protein
MCHPGSSLAACWISSAALPSGVSVLLDDLGRRRVRDREDDDVRVEWVAGGPGGHRDWSSSVGASGLPLIRNYPSPAWTTAPRPEERERQGVALRKGGQYRAMRRMAAPLLATLVLGGCSGWHTTQEESAGGTADTLLKTCAADRPQESLELLTPAARDFFTAAPSTLDGCLGLLGLRFRGVPRAQVAGKLRATRVVSVRANDLSATAELRAPDGSRSHLELEKSRGVWAVTHPR